MQVDVELLTRFESGLDPARIEASHVPARLLGFGEISAIFEISGDPETAYKRMPLFSSRAAAQAYAARYHEYCTLLSRAGLHLPASSTHVVEVPGHPVALYIAQRRLPPERVAHRLIHELDPEGFRALVDGILGEIEKVWTFNETQAPGRQLALDGQISNWVLQEDPGEPARLLYLDTSTPLYRVDGVEQLDPRLLLQAAPGYLRWVLERLFLDDVMSRYYDPRKVYTDLAANLIKEQRADLIPETLAIVHRRRAFTPPLTGKEIRRYYAEDRVIWSAFLTLRRLDRWVTTRLRRRRYEFILPGRIRR